MQLDLQAQAVLLLTVSFGTSDPPGSAPLTVKEWARFAAWLKDHGLEPASLVKGDVATLTEGWIDRSVSLDRIRALLGRGAALGLALEKWQRAGLWFLTRSDPDYPERLKRRLRLESPAVLFGSGNRALLNKGGVAVVGSRDASDKDLAFSEGLGQNAATQGYSIVSGGARGVDRAAMMGALECQGTAVGVLADNLLKLATSAQFRKHIMSGDLVLITPFNPEAGFNVGLAMSRNRYIYCLADGAVVVSSTAGKGGTWNGALENLKAAWVPLWVKHSTNATSGNAELVQKGAHWFPDDPTSLAELLSGLPASAGSNLRPDLPLLAPSAADHPIVSKIDQGVAEVPRAGGQISPECAQPVSSQGAAAGRTANGVGMDFYSLFLNRLTDVTAAAALSAEEIATALDLEKPQVMAWLKRGVSGGAISKLKKPTRYQLAAVGQQQASLFEIGG